MSPEQPALVSEPAAVRRRIVATPQRTTPPVALIIRERGSLPALEEALQRTRPVVFFPSLSHFCTDAQRSERWAGVVIARPCAWDARLDDYVVDRACMALYGDAEGYGWPEQVERLLDDGVARWLAELDQPRVRVPVAKPRKKREPSATRRARTVFTLWDPSKAVQVASEPKTEAEPAVSRVVSLPPANIEVVREPKSRGFARSPKGELRPVQQSLPFPEPAARAEKARSATQREAAHAAVLGMLTPRRAKAHEKALSAQEERLVRMGAELGLSRARELLASLRTRARELAQR